MSLFQYSDEFEHLNEMLETSEFFMETFTQFLLQWYLVYVQYYSVKFATNSQILSLYKSQLIFPLGLAKICVPQIFHGDQQESLSKSIK